MLALLDGCVYDVCLLFRSCKLYFVLFSWLNPFYFNNRIQFPFIASWSNTNVRQEFSWMNELKWKHNTYTFSSFVLSYHIAACAIYFHVKHSILSSSAYRTSLNSRHNRVSAFLLYMRFCTSLVSWVTEKVLRSKIYKITYAISLFNIRKFKLLYFLYFL